MNIVDCLKEKEAFISLQGADEQAIENSEQALGVKFAKEYKNYVKAFGAASYYGHELTGVCNAPAIDVVAVTTQERDFSGDIPADWYVIEQAHIDGIVFWQDKKGFIHKTGPGKKPVKVCDSLLEYIKKQS